MVPAGQSSDDRPESTPPQQQEPPGSTREMAPRAQDELTGYVGRGLLAGRLALATGADSGIGRGGVAEKGTDMAVACLSEHDHAEHTADLVRERGRQ